MSPTTRTASRLMNNQSNQPNQLKLTKESEALYQELKSAFQSSNQSKSNQIHQLLIKLKIALAQSSLLMPTLKDSTLIDSDSLTKARDILEFGAFYSVRSQDIPAFERYIAQLGPYYNDYNSILPNSERRYPIIGLDLLRLLSQNKIAQFHTVLEGLVKEHGQKNIDILHTNPYISHPVNLERWLMEGSYSKVWSARSKIPMEEYRYFVDLLVDTIRNEIASCEEKAYASLPLSDAGTLLFFKTVGEVIEFAQKRDWQIDPISKSIIFPELSGIRHEIAKEKVIEATLGYAKELETIV
ncbi:COP9 signalosome [Melampsora americana]|nr:COP9 signalosome [Melampsora americana]